MLLWLWCRPAATAPIRPLAWEPPYAVGAAQEMAKRQKKKKKEEKKRIYIEKGKTGAWFLLVHFPAHLLLRLLFGAQHLNCQELLLKIVGSENEKKRFGSSRKKQN